MIKFLFLIFTITTGVLASSALSAENRHLPDTESNAELVALALKYEHAEGVPRDYLKAVELYCRAAKTGDAEAQFSLGWLYANGRGVEKSNEIAAYLFSMASKQKHEYASIVLRYVQPQSPSAHNRHIPECMRSGPSIFARNPGKNKILSLERQAGESHKIKKNRGFKLIRELTVTDELNDANPD